LSAQIRPWPLFFIYQRLKWKIQEMGEKLELYNIDEVIKTKKMMESYQAKNRTETL
jgi:fructosamine-3-kinase